jgi:hypothetical protein
MTTYTNLGVSTILELKFENLGLFRSIVDASKNHSDLRIYSRVAEDSIKSLEDMNITDDIFSVLIKVKDEKEFDELMEKYEDEYVLLKGEEMIIMYSIFYMDGYTYPGHQIFGEAGLPNIEDLISGLRKAKSLFLELGIPEDQINLGYRMSQC